VGRLVRTMSRRRKLVVACWALVVVAALPLAAKQTHHLTGGGYLVPGSASNRVEAVLSRWPVNVPNGAVLLVAPNADSQPLTKASVRVKQELAGISGVHQSAPQSTTRVGARAVTILPVSLNGDQDRRIDTATRLRPAIHADQTLGGVRVYLVGQDGLWAAMHQLSTQQLTAAESLGVPVTLILLLIIFGAVAAAALPLLLAMASVLVTGAAVFFLSQALPMSVFVTNAASMVGVGVAVDYSLFIVARYREAIREGEPEDDALATAMRTSGVAVSFSGATVVAALLGLFLIDSVTLRSMALGMIIVVAFSVLGAVTLIPALISILGPRVYAQGFIRRVTGRAQRLFKRHPPSPADAERPDFWWRWSERVMRRPLLSALGAATFMLVLAVPALSISIGENAIGQFPAKYPARVGTELAQRALGPAALAPITEVATFSHGAATTAASRHAVDAWIAGLRADRAVAEVLPPDFTADGDRAILTIRTRAPAESTAAEHLLAALRTQATNGHGLAALASIDVGGDTALNDDFVTLVAHSMWKIALFILVISYLILMVMLRSVILPLKALIMTLLSVASACGVLVVLFKWGWIDHLFGQPAPGHIDSTTPPLLLTLVFGLSMDYEVFMLSRIREAYDATQDTHSAVALGLRKCAGPVSSAALIMVSVFAAFAATGVPSIRQLGTGLAVAIALDATVVRLILVPAAMELLGRWNWWVPRFLATRIPEPALARSGS
jgi:uncharacterized membrane protein YdfJ with MMPL/SSD domain